MILCGGGAFPPLINPDAITLNRNKRKNHRFGIRCSATEKDAQPSLNFEFLTKKPYDPPSWATNLDPIPSHVYSLGHYPTPIHKWNLPKLPKNTEVYIKRDDLSGMQLSGNKVRKLEFLLADAVAQGKDCVITIGGIQSNHCRATAVAAKYLNLECHLILSTSKDLLGKDPGLTGNLMVDRLAGAHVYLASKESEVEDLANFLKAKLVKENKMPYVIPVGGSNSLGAWGYIEAIREIEMQLQKSGSSQLSENESASNLGFFDYIVVACGSGGTIAGLSIGSSLSELKAEVCAFCISSTPEYFYDVAQNLLDGLQAKVKSRDVVTIKNATGGGYAVNKIEELRYIKEVAEATGVILDPVYSGKAAYGMWKAMDEKPSEWEGKGILFIHTDGLLGLFDKTAEMKPLVLECEILDVHKSVPQEDDTGKNVKQ